jgi:hypothetical protein
MRTAIVKITLKNGNRIEVNTNNPDIAVYHKRNLPSGKSVWFDITQYSDGEKLPELYEIKPYYRRSDGDNVTIFCEEI